MRILGTGFQRAGKACRILIGTSSSFSGGSALTLSSWGTTFTGEDYSTVNFESFNLTDSESYDEGLHGPVGVDCQFGGDWDAGANQLGPTGFPSTSATVPSLYPRDDLTGVAFINNRIDLLGWFFPFMRVRSVQNGGEVRGKVTFSVQHARNQGRFTFPIASAVGGSP